MSVNLKEFLFPSEKKNQGNLDTVIRTNPGIIENVEGEESQHKNPKNII